jgi:hypothetical protein
MNTAWAWLTWGLAAIGVVAVLTAVTSLSGRLRLLRRALRRLGWRRWALEHLRNRAEATGERVAALAEQAQTVPEESLRRLREFARPGTERAGGPDTRP